MQKIFHYFLPNPANNHRAKLLHHKSLIIVILVLFFGSFLTSFFRNNIASVLGDSVDISIAKLLLLTNQERQENGLPPLVLNQKLLDAANKKGDDMLLKNYWAHNSPDGKTPWVFIREAGYNYIYAGENLAKGFSSSDEIVNAWMQSAKHRENVLSPNYKDVGFAIQSGKLNGETTILVVEEFGSEVGMIAESVPVSSYEVAFSKRSIVEKSVEGITSSNVGKSFVSILSFSKNIDKILLTVFIFTLFLDAAIIERRKIVRFVGHNLDHILFLIIVLLFLGLISKGGIV